MANRHSLEYMRKQNLTLIQVILLLFILRVAILIDREIKLRI